MAVDKLVDSTQLNTDLTSVANAIRTKGGTSTQLAFPSGFVSAVEAIPTGGGSSMASGKYTAAERLKTTVFDTGLDSVSGFIIMSTGTADLTTGVGFCDGVGMIGSQFFSMMSNSTGTNVIGTGFTGPVGGTVQNQLIGVSSNIDGVITIETSQGLTNNSRTFQVGLEYTWYAW